MLKLINIIKEYPTGDSKVTALKGVDVEFRRSEFVSILGHSGCGKTTLLNIIGGLDHYTSGDLIIEGKSTKDFNDSDWDNYRNHSVGFVFQSYNLIPHQTVLANVELALTLSGVSKADRKQRAIDALKEVGLGDQIYKKPNQLSGGQMQRVAIARALVNDPEIVLADEPTGALDSETSVQIMDILREISKNRLVIMVTHNPEIAQEYSTRIIKLVDGKIVDDSAPYTEDDEDRAVAEAKKNQQDKKPSMSALTALSLSLNNLMTKKVRTFLTSFAGSIGIIGIALILSLSNGFNLYIEAIQTETLSSYPMTIDGTYVDMSSAMNAISGATGGSGSSGAINHELDKVYSNSMASSLMTSMTNEIWSNDLASFKKYLEAHQDELSEYISSVQYKYAGEMCIYSSDAGNGLNQVHPSPALQLMDTMMGSMDLGGFQLDQSTLEALKSTYNTWQELVDNQELLEDEYELVKGEWPKEYNEVVLVIDKNNEISPLTIQGLGLISQQEMMDTFMSAMNGGAAAEDAFKQMSIEYEDVLGLTFKLLIRPDYFQYNEETKQWEDMRTDDYYVLNQMENAEEIKIVGIIRPADDAVMVNTMGIVGYTSKLTEHIVEKTNQSEIVKQQKANPTVDVFTGIPFPVEEKEAQVEEVKTETKETTVDGWEKPVVSSLAFDGDAPSASFTATPSMDIGMINDLPDASVDEIKAEIDKNYTGEEAEHYKRMVDLMMKSLLTSAERKELMGYLDEVLSQAPEAAENGLDAQTALNLFRTALNDTQRRKILYAMVNGTFAEMMGVEVADNPKDDKKEDEKKPEKEVVEEPVVEEPKPLTNSYNEALTLLGVGDLEHPTQINIYPKDFESKDIISNFIAEYNEGTDDDKEIKYTDYIGLLLSSVTKIINIVSYVLIAFVAISLVVSSIMIGIITYISVLERTKEIGILRAIGASKRDISRVFNAETLIVGFVSGFLGIISTLILNIPINLIIAHLTDLKNVAQLPTEGAIILVIISMVLTFVAGLIPSGIASRKDPVVALRTE